MGNIYNYSDEKLVSENQFLKEKIISLEREIGNLKEINSLLKEKI